MYVCLFVCMYVWIENAGNVQFAYNGENLFLALATIYYILSARFGLFFYMCHIKYLIRLILLIDQVDCNK